MARYDAVFGVVVLCRLIRTHGAMKYTHEFRDPLHTFISVRTDERKVIDSRPFQRLAISISLRSPTLSTQGPLTNDSSTRLA
jgi:hypothetical protein